jgi:dolichol-phosphate hexosyltransferase
MDSKESLLQHVRNSTTAVIPAKNEEGSIGLVVEQCRAYCDRVLVVDGHSNDKTRELAEKSGAKVISDHGRGKGDAIRTGLAAIESEFAVFLDADGSHLAEDIPRLVEPLITDGADHVIGSRLTGGSSELHGGFDEFFRLTGSSLMTACVNRRFRVRLSDSQNGFRAIRVSAIRGLRLTEDAITIEQELLIRSLEAGLKVTERPAHEYRRIAGVSHVKLWRVTPRYLWMLATEFLLKRDFYLAD